MADDKPDDTPYLAICDACGAVVIVDALIYEALPQPSRYVCADCATQQLSLLDEKAWGV